MQDHSLSQAALKQQAKTLAQFFLEQDGAKLQHSKALEAMSRVHGYRNWQTAQALLPADTPPTAAGLQAAVLPALEPAMLELVDRRFAEVTKYADDHTLHALRELFKRVTPMQNCLSVHALMQEANVLTAAGHASRRKAMREVIQELHQQYRLGGDMLAENVLGLARKYYPNNLFVPLMQQTPATYKRHQAPANKFQERVFNLDMSLITVGSMNNSTRGLWDIKTDLLHWRLTSRWAESLAGLVTVIYTTEAFLDKSGGVPAQQMELAFQSVEAAKAAALPTGTVSATIKVEGGVHTYSGAFGWEFHSEESVAPTA